MTEPKILEQRTLKAIDKKIGQIVTELTDHRLALKAFRDWLFEQVEANNYQVYSGQEFFYLNVPECPICNQKMMDEDEQRFFSKIEECSQSYQMKLRGITPSSTTTVDGKRICCDCDNAGHGHFLCKLCDTSYAIDKTTYKVTEAGHYICSNCLDQLSDACLLSPNK